MTVIARITTQKRSASRYNIYLQDEKGERYGFSVDEAILVEFNLRKGIELSVSQLKALQDKDDFYKSYTLAIHYLSYRMRTEKEIRFYLKQKEQVDEAHIPDIIDKLAKEGLIDDAAFARAFVQTRLQTASKGPRIIKMELIEKGVKAVIADQALEAYSFEEQVNKATQLVEKKMRTKKKEAHSKQVQQLHHHLLQKGYSHDVIDVALQEIQAEKQDDAEKEALVFQGEKLHRKFIRRYTGYELKQKLKEGLYRKGFNIQDINQFLDEIDHEEVE